MQLAMLWTLSLFPSTLALPLLKIPDAKGIRPEQQQEQALTYLKRFYPSNSNVKDEDALEVKVKMMQKFFGLPITGEINSDIVEIMQKPRCGVPDIANYTLFPDMPRWPYRVVTYTIVSYTNHLPPAIVNHLVKKAFEIWGREIPLEFVEVIDEQYADIVISFSRGAHGDNYPFKGPGNTLAHAYSPGQGLGGDVHFDLDEFWTHSQNRGISFLIVATHEFGHSLGLAHSSDPRAVMYPTYRKRDLSDFRLSQDDINGIQRLYGN
ncbi:matrilysin [Suncus etruscus]|uniref:matrilysin n=1 Tax=Suncus etruscus TaxID=109475 RepID=UPI00210FE785|nr:matrilysin [Suncus etruscus]